MSVIFSSGPIKRANFSRIGLRKLCFKRFPAINVTEMNILPHNLVKFLKIFFRKSLQSMPIVSLCGRL